MLLWALILGAIAARLLAPALRRRRENAAASTLLTSFGVQPSGPEGTWLRRDRLRSAAVSGGACVACVAGAFAAYAVAERFDNLSAANQVSSFFGLLFFILAAIALLAALGALVRAPFTPSAPRPSIGSEEQYTREA